MSDLQVLSSDLFELLRRKEVVMTTAESCTGGLISKIMTDFPGSSDILWGGFVTYSNDAKTRLLGVSTETLEAYGAVSDQTVRSMAEGALKASGADCSVAVSGIAGPGGGTVEKPVGTVWISAALKGQSTVSSLFNFSGDRKEIREKTALEALRMLSDLILAN